MMFPSNIKKVQSYIEKRNGIEIPFPQMVIHSTNKS
jgi:hypothetical protein